MQVHPKQAKREQKCTMWAMIPIHLALTGLAALISHGFNNKILVVITRASSSSRKTGIPVLVKLLPLFGGHMPYSFRSRYKRAPDHPPPAC